LVDVRQKREILVSSGKRARLRKPRYMGARRSLPRKSSPPIYWGQIKGKKVDYILQFPSYVYGEKKKSRSENSTAERKGR